MRIAYLSSSSIPSQAANSVHVMKMCAALATNGTDVTLYARSGRSRKNPFGIYGVEESFRIEYVNAKHIRWVGGILQGYSVSRRLSSAEQLPELLYGRHIYSLAWASRLGIPFIIELHNIHPKKLIRDLTVKLLRKAHCLGVVVISDALRRDLLALVPWVGDKVVVAHDAADDPVSKGFTLPEYRDHSGVRVGYVGHLYKGKGMEVIAKLGERMPQTEFRVVGGTVEDIDRWKSRIGARNIVFDGFLPHSELPGKYLGFDLCLLPIQERVVGFGGKGSYGEIGRWTSPLKMFEYMSYGLPIVASNVPVLREILRHGENALLVDPGNIEGWVAAIDMLSRDPALRARIGRQARQDFLNGHTWAVRASQVTGALVKL